MGKPVAWNDLSRSPYCDDQYQLSMYRPMTYKNDISQWQMTIGTPKICFQWQRSFWCDMKRQWQKLDPDVECILTFVHTNQYKNVHIHGNRFKTYLQILWPRTTSERPELAEIWTHIVLGWAQGYTSQCPSVQVRGNLGTDRTLWRQGAPVELLLPGNWRYLRTR